MAVQFQEYVTFEAKTIVFTGATFYRNCRFISCLVILRPNPLADLALFPVKDCLFEFCRFHLDFIVNDVKRWSQLKEILPALFPSGAWETPKD